MIEGNAPAAAEGAVAHYFSDRLGLDPASGANVPPVVQSAVVDPAAPVELLARSGSSEPAASAGDFEFEAENQLISSVSPGGTNVFDIGAFLGAGRYYSNGITGQNTKTANLEAGHVWNGHESLQHVTNFFASSATWSNGNTAALYDRHATWAGMVIGGRQTAVGGKLEQQGIAYGTDLISRAIATNWSGSAYALSFGISSPSYRAAMTNSFTQADVINSSYGYSDPSGSNFATMFTDAMARSNPTTTYVVSAGNSTNANTVGAPGSGYNTITVGALGSANGYNSIASFSSRGPQDFWTYTGSTTNTGSVIAGVRAAVDISAPGTSIRSAYFGGQAGGNNPTLSGSSAWVTNATTYSTVDGTSFSAPIVAGGVALMASAAKTLPALSNTSEARQSVVLKALLLTGADKTSGWSNGQGTTNGIVTTTQSLDWVVGAGRMNLDRTFDLQVNGQKGVSGTNTGNLGVVSASGWDFGAAQRASTNSYTLSGRLLGGTTFTTTLSWLRERSYTLLAEETFSARDQAQADLNLSLWQLGVDNSFQTLVAQSISLYNVVEHLSFALPTTGYYGLRVGYASNTFDLTAGQTWGTGSNLQSYGLAWSGTSLAGDQVVFRMQTNHFNAVRIERNNSPPFAGAFNNGTNEVGLFANNGSFNNTPGAAGFQTFTTTGNGNTGTARPLQVGDTFTITAFSSTNPSAGGRMGISFRDSTNYTDFFSSTDADTEIRLQLDSSGNWKVYEGGTERMTSSSGAGADRTLVVKITSSTTFDAQIGGTWYYNFTMGAGGGLVDSFALYTFGDSNPDIYWKNGLLEDSGTVELGYALGSASSRAYAGNVFTPGVITDGLAATSNVTVRTNSVFVGGDSGSQVNLANSNSFSGALTVNANATLEAQHAHALGATNAGTTVTAGGALKLFSPSGISYATESLVLSGTGLGGTNGALRSVGGNNTWNGAITLGSNVRINADTTGGAGSLSIAGAIDGGNNTLFLGADGAAIGISGAITGAGATNSGVLTSVYKDGASTLTLSGVNAFSGAVRVATGTLLVGSSAALGTTAGATTVDSGAVFAMSNNITISENLTINGTGVSAGGVLRNLSGDNTHNGTLSLGSASRVSSDAGTLTLGGTVSGSNVGLTVGGAGNTAIQTAVGIGSGRLTKEDAGTLTLSAANDYTGGTLISGGRLVGDTRSLQGAITNNAALTFAQATNGTYAGLVSGTGSVVKTNSGAVTFSGANSYSGGTLVAGGTLIGDTRSLQGTITNTAAVTFSQTTNGSYTGLMSGSGGTLTKSGIGTVTLTANNAYTGATTVGAGRLIVNGSQGSSAVTVSNGASLGGSGTVGALTVSGLLAPGNSIGTLSAGNTVFNGGGSFELEMFDWVNSAGTGWDLLAITGNLTLSNTSGSPFTINLVSLQNSSTPGLSTDWNQDVNFTNTFVTYTGTLGGTAFNANLFTVNTNGFQNPFSGTFSITNVSGGLALLYTSAFVPSSTYTWNAGSGLWGTTGNWTNGAAPTNGASIIFAGAAGGSSTNSSTVSSIQGLVFSNTAGSYTVSGSALAVGVDGISNASTSAQTISNNLSFAANAAITAGAGNLTLAGNLTNGGNAVTVGGGSNTTISGTVSGSGALSKLGSGTLLLGGANNFTGATTIAGGTVVANNASSLGATNAGTTVADGASLHFSGGVTSAESITIAGNGLGGGGAIRSLGDGENTLTGTITLSGNARINVDAPIGSVTTLSSLGSGAFTIVDSFNTTFTQSLTNLTVTSAILGGTVAGEFASDTNWSSVSTFGLRMSTTKNPGVFVEAAFYDSIPELLRTYQTSTDGLMGVPSVMILSFVDGTSSLSNVRYLQFKLNDDFSSPENLSFIDLVSVPTSGLIISGNVNAGANVLTVGSASGAAGTVADGVRLTGVISGSGNTFSSTTTSLVKDGGGTVYLSGNNTFTGDARVLDGVLDVVFGASTNALGTGSDLFISSLGTLSLSGSVSTSSLQGAGTGDAGNVVLANKSVLTVNGAGKTMTMAGSISGSGAIRLDGNSSTVLTLTGDNTFDNGVSTAVTVAAGTLVLAGTEGNQALRLAGRIAVGASGKLLLQSSDQVRDNSIISLSGGTIQRAGGVSEVFGNLNLTTASFIDYGTGATGTLRFGTYTPSSLLTVQNFLPGNKLQFGSTLTEGELNNPTLFAFSNGFTTGTEGGFFTITAIPEPSTYLAAAGLLALFLWPVRRRLITDAKSILGLRPASHVRIDS